MNLLAAVLILSAVPAPPTPAPSPAAPPAVESTLRLAVIYGGAAALDLGATEWGLARGAGVEANPLMQDRGVRIAATVATVAVMIRGTQALQRHGHPRAARLLKWTFVGLRVGLAAHAVNVTRKAR